MLDGDEVLLLFEPQARGVIVEFREFVFEHFDKLDLDHDGFLSREELLTALYQPERNMREVSFLNFLLARIREIAECFKEEGVNRPDAISRMDVQEYFANLLAEAPAED